MKYLAVLFTVLFSSAALAQSDCVLNFTPPESYVTGAAIQESDKPLVYDIFVNSSEEAVRIEHGPPVPCDEIGVPAKGEPPFGVFEAIVITVTQSGARSTESNLATWENPIPKPEPVMDLRFE